jgi:hypothetical protein
MERPRWWHGDLTGEDGGDWVARRRRPWRRGGGVGSAWSARGVDMPSVLRQAGLGGSEEADRWAAGN